MNASETYTFMDMFGEGVAREEGFPAISGKVRFAIGTG